MNVSQIMEGVMLKRVVQILQEILVVLVMKDTMEMVLIVKVQALLLFDTFETKK